ncbi:MAG: type II toxin-antitoxin system YafQ family toxin [Pseudomonadota bacterium]|nr:type II toxin-antitoxin system YafQ family toxin [Pseudomonadota bacterium]
MRRIDRTKPFRRDFKRIGSTPEHEGSGVALQEVLDRLAADLPLPEKHRDHALRGNWAGHRECHVEPDLLLIYKKTAGILRLVRLASHSELF